METFISWFTIAIVYGTILSLSACGETINEKVGHLNLGIPGIRYLSGVSSFALTSRYEGTGNPNGFVVARIAILSSFAVGAVLGFIYSLFAVTFKCNQNVLGLAIASFGVGFGKFISVRLGNTPKLTKANQVFNAGIPFFKDLGVVGKLFFNYGFRTYITLLILILARLFFRKTKIGLNLRAIGESPATSDAVGLNVTKYKYIATRIGCGLAGLGGRIYVRQFSTGSWSTNNNIEALGWLAVALVIFASWKPVHLIWGAPLFGFLFWAWTYLPSLLKISGFKGRNELLERLPYLVTILILVFNSRRKKKENQPPESLGLSYFRENR